jgi:hypothetical protein
MVGSGSEKRGGKRCLIYWILINISTYKHVIAGSISVEV